MSKLIPFVSVKERPALRATLFLLTPTFVLFSATFFKDRKTAARTLDSY